MYRSTEHTQRKKEVIRIRVWQIREAFGHNAWIADYYMQFLFMGD